MATRNTFNCGGLNYTSPIQAARFISIGCDVQIVRDGIVQGYAFKGEDRYILRNARLRSDHILSIPHTDLTRLACHLDGFAMA